MAGQEAVRAPGVAGRLESLLVPLFSALAILAAFAGAAIVALTGASVAMRYFANAPFRFTEELVGLLMTAAFFLALPLVTLRAEHVRVQVFVNALPARLRRAAVVLANLFGIGFCLWFVWLALPWFEFAFQRGIKTEVARLLMYPWMALLPLSLFLSALAFAVRGLAAATGNRPGAETGIA